MTFHSELQIVWLIFEGGVSSIVNSMYDVRRGSHVTVMLLWEKIVCRYYPLEGPYANYVYAFVSILLSLALTLLKP